MSINPDSIPRYAQPMDRGPEQSPKCEDCAFFKPLSKRGKGVCVVEVYGAETDADLMLADVMEVDRADEPCPDFKDV